MTKLTLTLAALLVAGCAVAQTVNPNEVQLLKSTIEATDRDNISDNSFRAVYHRDPSTNEIQHASSLFTWNAWGSTGVFQMEAFYFGNLNFRNKTDNSSWTPWKGIWTSGNFKPDNYLKAAVNEWNKDVTGRDRIFFHTLDANTGATTFIRGYGETPLRIMNATSQTIMQLAENGDMSIGVNLLDSKGYKLAVGGNMIAEKIKVKMQSAWPDFVFHESYSLLSLADLERYIKMHSHLPEMPDAKAIAEDGLDVGEMNRKLLQKVEELTLYIIQQNKEMQAVKERLKTLEATSKQ